MAYAGQTISNPITGEHFTFLRTTDQTHGELLVCDCRVTPGGARIAPHKHATQEERFQVLSGTLGVMLGGKKQILQAGDKIVLPARVKHQWWNAGDGEVRFRVEVAPARNLEAVLEALATMARDGKLNKRAMPKNPFVLANLGRFSETYLPGIPIWMQKLGLAMGSTLGRVFGHRPDLSEYRTAALETEVAAAA